MRGEYCRDKTGHEPEGATMAVHHGEKMIEANGIEICTDSFGDASDPTILLIMGAGASMLLWEEGFCSQLADGGRFVIRYDNRDTGKTTSRPLGEPNYTIDDMALDAVAVLDAYDVDAAHIIGASMGGMITQVVGLNHPERVLSLTPIMSTPDPQAVLDAIEGREPSFALSPPTAEVVSLAIAAATLDWDDEAAVLDNRVDMFKVLTGPAHPYDEPARRALFAAEIERAVNFPSTQNHGPAIEGSDSWHQRLDSLDVPTLVIHGTADPILPYDHGEALVASIPGARMLSLDGIGHELPEPEWDKVIAAMLEHTSS